jgi:hypothetical protein
LVAARGGGPLLAANGGRVILECQRPLARLFSGLVAGISGALVVKGEALPAFDVQAPLMSLPHIFGTDASTIPANVPYLGVDSALQATWAERLQAYSSPRLGPRVGLVWAGNPRHENDANRSMPAAAFARLLEKQGLEKQGVTLFSLQVGATDADKAWLRQTPIHDLAPDLNDFADTAAVLGHLDLVISVDTAVAHLAGALARPVWLLTPFVPEWRWMLDRADSPWYPTMRLFRQAAPGDWAELMARVAAALDDMLDGMTGARP